MFIIRNKYENLICPIKKINSIRKMAFMFQKMTMETCYPVTLSTKGYQY